MNLENVIIQPGKKLQFAAKIWVTFASSDVLIVTGETINDFLFEIRFAEGTGRKTFENLLKDIDLNGQDMNWAQFTIENLLDKKQIKELKKVRESNKEPEEAKIKRMTKLFKVRLLRERDILKGQEKRTKQVKKSIKYYEKEIRKLKKRSLKK